MRKELLHRKLERFQIGNLQDEFMGAHLFSCHDRHLMIEKCGHIIMIDDCLLDEILNKNISEDFRIKLIQRNFINSSLQSYEIISNNRQIEPYFFMIDFTRKCNMQCTYCFREGFEHKDESIKEDNIQKICNFIIGNCKKNGCNNIMIQPWGGEPLLEKEKIFSMQDNFRDSEIGVCISVETNGLLLDEKMIDELAARDIVLGISIDGIERVHDMQRVKFGNIGTFSSVVKGIKMLKSKIGNNFGIIMTVTRNTIPYIESCLDFFAKELDISYIKTNFVHKSDFVDNEGVCLSGDEIRECSIRIFDKVMELNEEGYDFFESNIHIRLLNLLGRRNSSICCSRGCNGGNKMITVDMEGFVYPCELTDYPEERIGHIDDGRTLSQMIKDAIKEKNYFAEKKEKKCHNCPWYFFCRGGCTIQAKCMGKAVGEVDDIECISNQVWYERLVEMILSKPHVINHFANGDILRF